MDLIEAIYSRRAVREFTAEPVDEKTLSNRRCHPSAERR